MFHSLVFVLYKEIDGCFKIREKEVEGFSPDVLKMQRLKQSVAMADY